MSTTQARKAAPANHEKHPLPTTKTPLPMERCCQSCGSSRPVAAFQSGFETLQTCSTCREQKARAKARSRARRRERVLVKNASMLKNSKLGQNDGVLRIIDSAFVQAASLCCLHS